MATVPRADLGNTRIPNLQASARVLDTKYDAEEKFKIFDELTTKELSSQSVAFAVLNQQASDPRISEYANKPDYKLGIMGPTIVSRIVDATDYCEQLSDYLMLSIGDQGKSRLQSICHQPKTYIHTKMAHALNRIVNSKNFATGSVHTSHPLHALNIVFWKLQSFNHGVSCPCHKHIQAQLKDNVNVVSSFAFECTSTLISVRFDAGLGNKLYIRGEGSNLSWEKGIELKNIGSDTWVFETDAQFSSLKYKILLNDQKWETGSNHQINHGKVEEVQPKF